MIFGQDRGELRQMYASAWQTYRDKGALSPLEMQIAQVIEDHPEYHEAVMGDLEQDFSVEGGKTNPFLHMGLHLAIRDQVAMDRPAGIAAIYQRLVRHSGDTHITEHMMLECLGEALWRAQIDHRPPDESAYLEALTRL